MQKREKKRLKKANEDKSVKEASIEEIVSDVAAENVVRSKLKYKICTGDYFSKESSEVTEMRRKCSV